MSAAEAQEVKDLLLQRDDQFRQLFEQHSRLDNRLLELTSRTYLSDSEQLEQVTLKKQKLRLKDQMEQIVRQFAQTRAS
jgi:hypothetical protein